MEISELKEELRRINEGHDGMTGPEYFYYNYITINGKRPEPRSFNHELFSKMQEQERNRVEVKMARGRNSLYHPFHDKLL